MNMALNKNKSIYDLLFAHSNIFLEMLMVLSSIFFMAIMANLRIPLWPIPITMQTFGVFLIAFFFGSRKGFLAILSYLAAGLFGFAVFAGYNSGTGAFIGPTGGYLVGFLFMALFVGLMIEKGYGRTRKSVLLCMLAGNLILYAFGLTGLWLYFGKISILKLLSIGLFPFLIGDLFKSITAAALFPYLWKGAEKITQ
ncbi:biotin transporter BioY [Candidatus Woesearchaeota archaeon]|nr:biotin transporter BioY [Candidatus Woesearchaeota archaeon]